MLLAYGTLIGVSNNQRINFKPVHFPEIKELPVQEHTMNCPVLCQFFHQTNQSFEL
jgi:hypothetical protein